MIVLFLIYLRWDELAHSFPERCNNDSYCPDNGSRCMPLIPVDGPCELQRDDECTGKEAICLNSTCFIKGVPLGGNCGSDRTDYISYDAGGFTIKQTIIRDNCTEETYCDYFVCIKSKEIGSNCWQDRECLSGTCSDEGVCITGPGVFHTIANWLWAVVGCSVCAFVIVTLGVLWLLHRYQRRIEQEKYVKFFGDNDKFLKKYQLSNSSVVYLTTPDYKESAVLSNNYLS
ncbi:uncharacterized protein RHIMIDRAFT_206573 [Rhizopus microsporus ATCC 52813]|uniref:Uncharacterized protein n=1 Tax=Rhizopus microsporus ATCC 52813 TaxID=1340429 RepID=A0A2G4SMC9_RHIZD|nr:uncharacterized protein RHIMIDRAFT_206573 [Rhizopus microsporus ATCC 52813]PHZ09546.1 hypothetical protein RHIMIDRAFT_206573 [Rhizopus microsporus ATCC 52813]